MTVQQPVPGGRADARRNREKILEVADEIFSTEGVGIALDRLIQALPVGKSTFFRHFPDRETLMAALLDRAMEELEDRAAHFGEDPAALFALLDYLAGAMGRRTGLIDYWTVLDLTHPTIAGSFQRFEGALRPAVIRAVEAGLCRPDMTAADIALWSQMLGGALRGGTAAERHDRAMRAKALFLNGIARPAG